ncbi:MAG: acyl-CoA dehydrogenase family protein [Acidimicrobiia bacterium]
MPGAIEEFRTWVDQNWSADLAVREWWARLAASGWGFPNFPAEWMGRGLAGDEATLIRDEILARNIVGPPGGIGQVMGAPLVLQFGTDDQKRRFLPGLLTGEEAWCQFFSEPGSGSDLASLQTRAERDGDEWVVNGQKVWTGGALESDKGLLLARTDSSLPKHRGISYFVIDIDQPGIEIRPIKQMNGQAHFNEVFFTDARVPDANRLSDVNNGWAVAMATLAFERSGFAAGHGYGRAIAPGRKGGNLDKVINDLLSTDDDEHDENALAKFPMGDAHVLIELAREFGRNDDPNIRQKLVKLYCMAECNHLTALRAKAAVAAGRTPGSESSLGYIAGVNLARASRDLAFEIAGGYGTLIDSDSPRDGAVVMMALSTLSHGIQGGTEQIQHNIVGERVLGLPKEPQVDRDLPFKDLRVGTQGRD